jgi:hypothetical protein
MLLFNRRGTVQKVAADGDPAPVAGTTFSSVTTPFLLLGDDTAVKPAVSGTRVAFTADLSDSSQGIFMWRNGGVSTIVHEGDAAPGGGSFGRFSEPSLRGRTAVFAAETGVGTCIVRSSRPASFQVQGCEGDAVPAPIGGTIAQFLTAPVYSVGTILFDASVSGGTSAECLLRRRGSRLEKLACAGEAAPSATTYSFFENVNFTPWIAQSGGAAASFAQVSDGMVDTQEITFFRSGTATKVVADNDPLPPPIGGVVEATLDASEFSMLGNRLVFETTVAGGTQSSAVFMAAIR